MLEEAANHRVARRRLKGENRFTVLGPAAKRDLGMPRFIFGDRAYSL